MVSIANEMKCNFCKHLPTLNILKPHKLYSYYPEPPVQAYFTHVQWAEKSLLQGQNVIMQTDVPAKKMS